jgi:hypothetical protein
VNNQTFPQSVTGGENHVKEKVFGAAVFRLSKELLAKSEIVC